MSATPTISWPISYSAPSVQPTASRVEWWYGLSETTRVFSALALRAPGRSATRALHVFALFAAGVRVNPLLFFAPREGRQPLPGHLTPAGRQGGMSEIFTGVATWRGARCGLRCWYQLWSRWRGCHAGLTDGDSHAQGSSPSPPGYQRLRSRCVNRPHDERSSTTSAPTDHSTRWPPFPTPT